MANTTYGDYFRETTDTFPQAIEELLSDTVLVVSTWHADGEDQTVFGLESGVDRREVGKASHQQPGAGEQQKRKRHFDRYQNASQLPLGAASGLPVAIPKRRRYLA